MELTVVVSVLGLDCAQHSSRIAPLNGDRDPLEEELEGTMLPCFCLEAMSQFVEELQGLWATVCFSTADLHGAKQLSLVPQSFIW